MYDPGAQRFKRSPSALERIAINLLAGVGNEREWWIFGCLGELIGHLRVGLTLDEVAQLEDYPVTADAGDAGPERRRSKPRVHAKARRH